MYVIVMILITSSNTQVAFMKPYGGFHKWGYPQSSSILMGFSRINHPFGGTPIYGNPHICIVIFRLGSPNISLPTSMNCSSQGMLTKSHGSKQCTSRYIWCIFVGLELVGIPAAKYPFVVGYTQAIISLPFCHFAFRLSTFLISIFVVAWRESMDAIPDSQKLSLANPKHKSF